MVNNKQKYMLMKYSTSIEKNCIQKHIDVINKLGFCWYGKIGSIPSNKILTAVFEEETPCIVLHKSTGSYLCHVTDYSTEKQLIGVPEYYSSCRIEPSIYFKLVSIDECDNRLFHNSIVCSTGSFVEDAIFHSRIPFMLCEYEDEKLHILLGANECRYSKDDFCTCRTCVNYTCYCEHPSMCRNQRR